MAYNRAKEKKERKKERREEEEEEDIVVYLLRTCDSHSEKLARFCLSFFPAGTFVVEKFCFVCAYFAYSCCCNFSAIAAAAADLSGLAIEAIPSSY